MKDCGYDNPRRYTGNELRIAPGAELRHFIPLVNLTERGISRDRFGNRIFISPTQSYKDRDSHIVKAAILLSTEGEEFIKTNRGILKDIDSGLRVFDPNRKTGSRPKNPGEDLNLGHSRVMRRFNEGKQSILYVLRTDSEEMVIKVKKFVWGLEDFSQPYINEMLQCQALNTDLKEALDRYEVEMPNFLFASGQVACRQFETGEKPTPQELIQRVGKILRLVDDYIHEQQTREIALWHNISADPQTSDALYTSAQNFIKRSDGRIVWIDPVFYNPPDHSW